ncbi:MAG: chorismate mutase [Proteobacteria bacterium]|nr:chorismate mutase [Pseudomonadota bacterium]
MNTGLACRGVRGATCVAENTTAAITVATRELLRAMLEANAIATEDIASIFFAATPDLYAAHPATAARELGLGDTALLCMTEIAVPGAPARCIRILLHWNTTRAQAAIEHIYLGAAAALRPERLWPRPPSVGTPTEGSAAPHSAGAQTKATLMGDGR